MVKVFPNNFTLFDQSIFTPSGEPLVITCSDECLFIAEEGCLLEVYKLDTLENIAQFRTISPVVQFVYNSIGDCVVTLEKKQPSAHGFARVYFNWRGSSVDKPVRVNLMDTLVKGKIQTQDRIAAEIVELPGEANSSVNCLACCEQTGRIAIGMGRTVRVFSVEVDRSSSASSEEYLPHNIQILLDIHTNITLKKVAIFDSYVAFISGYEARVVKISLLNSGSKLIMREYPVKEDEEECYQARLQSSEEIAKDSSFVSWSPSKVWEVELQSMTSTLSFRGRVSSQNSDQVTSHDPPPSPVAQVGTLTLPTISQATLTKSTDRHATEVLGPVEYVWGQPVEVEVENACQMDTQKCRLLTMLYRRFPCNTGGRDERRRAGSLYARYTLPGRMEDVVKKEEGGLHSVQLVPTLVKDENGSQLVGICCFLANKYHGYLYDVHQKTKLMSSFSFMSKSTAVSYETSFMHVLSVDSVEIYTSRAFPAAIANMPSVSSCIPPTVGGCGRVRGDDEERGEGEETGEGEEEEEEEGRTVSVSEWRDVWLKQPCPSPSMDLTLLSSNKFIGGCCLATTPDHMIVLTKSEEAMQPTVETSTTSWFLQSLTLRRAPRGTPEPSWNIYVLKKRDPLSLYQQFLEFADSLKGGSPPMYQHVLSEGHMLLRSHVTQATPPCPVDLVSALRDNCFSLADTICARPTSKGAVTMAARYLVLSGMTVAEVFQHITGSYPKSSSTAYSVLTKYLGMVLFEKQNAASQAHSLFPLADRLLDLYAEQDPKQLTRLLLYSWLREYSTEKALKMLEQCLPLTTSPEESHLGHICQTVLHVQSGQHGEGIETLSKVPDEFLIKWMSDNLHFLVNSSVQPQQLTALGKLFQSAKEGCLLEVFSQCLTTELLCFEVVCNLLEVHNRAELADNVSLKQFLEKILLGTMEAVGQGTVARAVLQLVEVLFARLSASHVPRPSTSSPFSLYGSRHKWLDCVTPFDGVAASTGKSPQSVLQDLMQLQALLCSQHMSKEVGCCVERLMEGGGKVMVGGGEEVTGALSLKLLTWPHTGRMTEATQLVLDSCPSVTVDYCLTYFKSHLEQWKGLMVAILRRIEEDTSPELESTYRSVYQGVLGHVVTLTSPEEFLDLLPPRGSLDFFLPFMEHSCKLFVSHQVAERLNTSVNHSSSS